LNNPLKYTDPSGHIIWADPNVEHEMRGRGNGFNFSQLIALDPYYTFVLKPMIGEHSYMYYLVQKENTRKLNDFITACGNFGLGLVAQAFTNPYNDIDGVVKDAKSALEKARLDPEFQNLERIWLNDRSGNNPFSIIVIDKSDWPTAGFDPDSGKIIISLPLFTMGYETLAGTMERFTALHVVVHEAVEASYMGLMVTHCDIINETSDIMVRLDTLYVRRTCSYEDKNIIN